MIDKVKSTIEKYSMLKKGDCVAVGFSGGADSTALLHCLCALSRELGVEVRAIHVNHGIRGESALKDEMFAREFCERQHIKLDCFTLDIPAIAREKGVGLEECGRECRYECFRKVAERCNCKTATAHTLSDCAETLLFNIARGCGLSGLRSIPPVRGDIIRPLIEVSRAQVEQYCAENGLSYVTDESNFDTRYQRNLIRQEIIPRLKAINPDFLGAAGRLSDCAREDDAFLFDVANAEVERAAGCFGCRADSIVSLAPPVRKRALISIARALTGCRPEYRHVLLIEDCLAQGEGAVTLPGKKRIIIKNGLISSDNEGQHNMARTQWCVDVSPQRETPLPDGRKLDIVPVVREEYITAQKNHNLLFKNAAGYDIIHGNLKIRNRRDGDRFSPAGRKITKKLKELLREAGIPSDARDSLAILEKDGQPVWIEGIGVCESVRVKPDDKTVYLIMLK